MMSGVQNPKVWPSSGLKRLNQAEFVKLFQVNRFSPKLTSNVNKSVTLTTRLVSTWFQSVDSCGYKYIKI
jgi:hypothetical protein